MGDGVADVVAAKIFFNFAGRISIRSKYRGLKTELCTAGIFFHAFASVLPICKSPSTSREKILNGGLLICTYI